MVNQTTEYKDKLGMPETLAIGQPEVLFPQGQLPPPERLLRTIPMTSRRVEARRLHSFGRSFALAAALLPLLLSGKSVPKNIANVALPPSSTAGINMGVDLALPELQIPRLPVFPGTEIRVQSHGATGVTLADVHGAVEVSEGPKHKLRPIQYETEVDDWSSYFRVDHRSVRAILRMERGSVSHKDGLFQVTEPVRKWLAGDALTLLELRSIARRIDPHFQEDNVTEKQLRALVLASFPVNADVQVAFGVKNISDKIARFGSPLGLLAYNSPRNAAEVLDQFHGDKEKANGFLSDLYNFMHGEEQDNGSDIIGVEVLGNIGHDGIWGWPYIDADVVAEGKYGAKLVRGAHYLMSLPLADRPGDGLSADDLVKFSKSSLAVTMQEMEGKTPLGAMDYLRGK